MSQRFRLWFPLAVAVLGLVSSGVHAQKDPALPDVLQAAGDYLVHYSQQLAAVAAEEQYTQYDTSTGLMKTPTRLNADFVLIGNGAGSVTGFRDVFAIGTAPVRKRDDRLLTLFTASPASALGQARQMTDDSVRYYLSSNLRALDQPTIALQFLQKENQERCTFKLDNVKTMSGARVAIVRFTERNTPRLVPSPEDGPAVGRFWIDVASGTVRQTELGIVGKSSNIRASVDYAAEPKLDIWLPVEMYQQVDVRGAGSGEISNMGSGGGYGAHQALEGRATYTKFRQVPVDLSKIR